MENIGRSQPPETTMIVCGCEHVDLGQVQGRVRQLAQIALDLNSILAPLGVVLIVNQVRRVGAMATSYQGALEVCLRSDLSADLQRQLTKLFEQLFAMTDQGVKLSLLPPPQKLDNPWPSFVQFRLPFPG